MVDVDKVIRYEAGEMPEDEMVEWFQELIDTRAVLWLQGHYGRTARDLVEAGLCRPAK